MKTDYDLLAREYARHRQVHPKVLENLIARGRVSHTARVLDVGCGTGNYAAALATHTGCACWGIEPSEAMLAKAREQAPGAEIEQGTAERLPYPADFFDLVFSVDVIHHVGDRGAYLRQAHRVLKPGGAICTVTDSEDIIARRQPLANYFPETVPIELKRYPRIGELEELMAEAGLTEIEQTVVELAYPLVDIGIYRDKAFSCLHLIPAHAFEQGLERMERDLQMQPIHCVSRYLLLWGNKLE